MRGRDDDLDGAVDALVNKALGDETFADRLHSSTLPTLLGTRELSGAQRSAVRGEPADDLLVALTQAGLPLPRGLSERLGDPHLREALGKISLAKRADPRFAEDLRVMPQVAMRRAPGLTEEQRALVQQTPVADLRLLLAALEGPRERSHKTAGAGLAAGGLTSKAAGTTSWILGYVPGTTFRLQQLTGDVDVVRRGSGFTLGFQGTSPSWSLQDGSGNDAQTEGFFPPLKTVNGQPVTTQPDDVAAENVTAGLTTFNWAVDGADAHISFAATWYNMPITESLTTSSGQMWLFGDTAEPLSFRKKGGLQYFYDTIGFSKGVKHGARQDADSGQLALSFFGIDKSIAPNRSQDPVGLRPDGTTTTLVAVPLMPNGDATIEVHDSGSGHHTFPLDLVSTGPGNGWAGGICLGSPDTVFAVYRYLNPAVTLLTRFDQLTSVRPHPIFSIVRVLSSNVGQSNGHFTGLAFRELHGAIEGLGAAQDWIVMFGCGGAPGAGGNLFLAVIPKAGFGNPAVQWSYLVDVTSAGVPKWLSFPDPGQTAPANDEGSQSLHPLVEAAAQLTNISVAFVPDLGRWIMLHEDQVAGKGTVFFRDAPKPWGPWGAPQLILSAYDAYQAGYVHDPSAWPGDGLDGPFGIGAGFLPYFPRLMEEFTLVWPAPGSTNGSMMMKIYWTVSGGGPYYSHLLTSTFQYFPDAQGGGATGGNHPPGTVGEVGGGPVLKQ